ncbi:M20/M25/M40 family metallo-hydrolase, partial [Agromyces humi]|uniref:M20/M25/M40 family metallo-hydrolase n=1 Tax=Agromyces humi TaxID=1766800 RepID=UPI00135C9F39
TARIPGTGAQQGSHPVVLLGHADTVWPRGTVAAHGVHRDGTRLSAPGAYDMKGGLVVAAHAMRLLQQCGVAHPPVVLLVTADEEVGSPTARDLVEMEANAARAVLGFESPHPDGALKTARLGSARVRLAVSGRAAHAALDPEAGVSAIEELVDQLLAVRGLAATLPAALVNTGTIAGGGLTNVVPAAAHADLGLRYPDAITEELLLGGLQALAPIRPGASLEVSVLSNRPAWQDTGTDGILRAAVAAAASVGQSLA